MDDLINSVFSKPSFDKRSWNGHNEFVMPAATYQSLKFGRDKHSKWNDHTDDTELVRAIQKTLYTTGKCLITCDTSGASTFLSHEKMVRNLKLTDDMIMSESARSFAVTAIFLASAGIVGKIDCFASPALMGSKIQLHAGYVIQDTRAKAHYDKTVSVLVFSASKDVVGYINPKDWAAKLQELVFADDITLLTSEIPGMELQFESNEVVYDKSLEFLKEGIEYEFTEEDGDYLDAFDYAISLGRTEEQADIFGQTVMCFLKWYNNSEFDVEDSFGYAVDEMLASPITVANNDLTGDLVAEIEKYIEDNYSLSDDPLDQDHINKNTDTQITPEQASNGDYAKAVINVQGFSVVIENPVGSVRSGISKDGTLWSNTMQANYGFFEGTAGADGDEVDVFVGPYLDSTKVFVINQVNLDQTFDEHKVMLGFNSENEAVDAYCKSFDDNWKGFGGAVRVPMEAFRSWVKDGVKGSALNEAILIHNRLVEATTPEESHKEVKAMIEVFNGKLTADVEKAILEFEINKGDESFVGDKTEDIYGQINALLDKERLRVNESTSSIDSLVESVFNESSLSLYVGDDKDAATNAYFKDVCERWKTSIIKASKKSKVVDWKVKDMFVASPSMLEMSFDYVNKEGKIEVLLYAADNGNAFDVHVTTLGKGGTRQPVIKGVRSFDKLVDDLEWFMLTVGV